DLSQRGDDPADRGGARRGRLSTGHPRRRRLPRDLGRRARAARHAGRHREEGEGGKAAAPVAHSRRPRAGPVASRFRRGAPLAPLRPELQPAAPQGPAPETSSEGNEVSADAGTTISAVAVTRAGAQVARRLRAGMPGVRVNVPERFAVQGDVPYT